MLISALPTVTIPELKESLFTALTGSSPQHITSPLPTSPSALVLGLPVNEEDYSAGWFAIGEDDEDSDVDSLDLEGINSDEEPETPKKGAGRWTGKRKRETVGNKGKKKRVKEEELTVASVGMKDLNVVAYYVKKDRLDGNDDYDPEEEFLVDFPKDDWDDEHEGVVGPGGWHRNVNDDAD